MQRKASWSFLDISTLDDRVGPRKQDLPDREDSRFEQPVTSAFLRPRPSVVRPHPFARRQLSSEP